MTLLRIFVATLYASRLASDGQAITLATVA